MPGAYTENQHRHPAHPPPISQAAGADTSLSHTPSRYRSTRTRPAHSSSSSPPSDLPSSSPPPTADGMMEQDSATGFGRSQSRYHRQRQRPSTAAPAGAHSAHPMPSPPPQQQQQQQQRRQQHQQQQQQQQSRPPQAPYPGGGVVAALPTAPSSQRYPARQPSDDNMFAGHGPPPPQRARTRVRPGTAQSPPPRAPLDDDRAQARQILEAEAERQRRMQAQIRAGKEAREREREEKQREERQREERQREERQREERQREEKQREEKQQQQQRQLEDEDAQRRLHEQELERQRKEVEEYELKQRREAEQRQWLQQEGGRPEGARLRKKGSAGDELAGARRSLGGSGGGSVGVGGKDQQSQVMPQKSSGGLFGLFRKRKADGAQRSSEVLRTQAVQQPAAAEKRFIKQGGGGIVPGTDAPVSAVNAGDRMVHVECNKSKIVLPVTPETTTQDLVRAASTCMAQPIDYARAILLENYFKVGLQRPLRKYEHIRDVLNSWDDDTSNTLTVSHALSSAESELSASQVSKDKPGFEAGWPMYYSQKPGSWEKRYIVVLSDGQVTAAKNEGGDKKVNVCHLSDFEIYTPTKQRARKVKPPKKHCYAIKSQQKSSMFQDVTSYVHYFSSGDAKVAESFYRAVQGWRSWYLVNVMGEGNTKKAALTQVSSADKSPYRVGERDVPGTRAGPHHRKDSSADSHYQLGTFQSLDLNADQFVLTSPHSPPRQAGPVRQPSQRQRRMSASGELPDNAPLAQFSGLKQGARQRAPPTSWGTQFGRQTSNDRPTSSHGDSRSQAPPDGAQDMYSPGFAPTDGGEHRRTSGSNNNAHRLQRTPSTRSQRRNSISGDNSLARSSSIRHSNSNRQMPQPLVDLTPQYKEPPQFQRKGHGYKGPVGPGGLIEAATTLQQDAIQVPPSQDWRGRNVAGDAGRPGTSDGQGGGAVARNKSLRGYGAPRAGGVGFTGQGLLATSQAQLGWGDGNQGRPHASMREGKRDGPMVDLSQESRFQQGSLLAGVERSGRGNGVEA